MNKIMLQLKSGREFMFECESYSLQIFKLDDRLCDFVYEGGIEECSIYLNSKDVEAIVIIHKGDDTE